MQFTSQVAQGSVPALQTAIVYPYMGPRLKPAFGRRSRVLQTTTQLRRQVNQLSSYTLGNNWILGFHIVTSATKKEVDVTEGMSSAEKDERKELLDNLIENMPKECYYRTNKTLGNNFRKSLENFSTPDLVQILEQQEELKRYIEKLRRDPVYASTVYEKLVRNKDSLLELQLLEINPKRSEDLEVFLERLACRNLKIPTIIGWAIAFKYLRSIEDWFSTDGLLKNLTKIQKYVLGNKAFESFKSTDSGRQMRAHVLENVSSNLFTLIQGATFLDNVKKHPELEVAKDHALVQPVTNVLLPFEQGLAELGRGEYEKNHLHEAYFSTNKANTTKTAGSLMYFPKILYASTPFVTML